MEISGWGKYPIIETNTFIPREISNLENYLPQKNEIIVRGLGRSYGDSSLSRNTIMTTYLDQYLDFDSQTGVLSCYSGVSLAEILETFVPEGWFLPVTPGTKFVTIGGAIASDVHGKNHHIDGSFSDHVSEMTIMIADGSVQTCSKTENSDLFKATCGGMGLTGIILTATLKLKPVTSVFIDQTIYKAKNLDDVLGLFENHKAATYTVAWIDCLSTGKSLGRSLLMVGEHAEDDMLELQTKKSFSVPFDMPSVLLNRYSVYAFNSLYYNKVRKKITKTKIHYDQFFYPLDSVHDWNRIYGKNGFTQYQFVIPKDCGAEGMTAVLEELSASKKGSFLAVLKEFGKGNDNYLSFPMEGYTLALDLKISKGIFALLKKLDKIVLKYGGRIYLTKDVCMSKDTFIGGYPRIGDFGNVRTAIDPSMKFSSIQSKRLGI